MNHQVMSESQALALTHAYTSMRDQIHRRNLLNQSADVRDSQLWLNVNKLYKLGSSGSVEHFCHLGGCDKLRPNLNIGD